MFGLPGNYRFIRLVDWHMDAYEAEDRAGKATIARILLDQIHQSSGRFLKRDSNGNLVEVSSSAAQEKIAHTFRNRIKLKRSRDTEHEKKA